MLQCCTVERSKLRYQYIEVCTFLKAFLCQESASMVSTLCTYLVRARNPLVKQKIQFQGFTCHDYNLIIRRAVVGDCG